LLLYVCAFLGTCIVHIRKKGKDHVSNDRVCLLLNAIQILNIIQILLLVLGEAEDDVLRCKSNNSKYDSLLCGHNVQLWHPCRVFKYII